MVKDIDNEINRLSSIKENIHVFNEMKMLHPKTVPISQSKYDELLRSQSLDSETFYWILDVEVGKYVDGYIDIEHIFER